MKQFLITAAGVFAGLVIFLVGVPIVLVGMALSAAAPAPIPAKTVLELDLRQPLTDQAPNNPLWGIGRNSTSVMSIIETLRRAEGDDRVKGLLVRLPEGGIEPGEADEIRLALTHFRTAGKPVYAHSQGIYPSGISTTAYMLGRASDAFWMQPGETLAGAARFGVDAMCAVGVGLMAATAAVGPTLLALALVLTMLIMSVRFALRRRRLA